MFFFNSLINLISYLIHKIIWDNEIHFSINAHDEMFFMLINNTKLYEIMKKLNHFLIYSFNIKILKINFVK